MYRREDRSFGSGRRCRELSEPDPKGHAKRSLPLSKHRAFSCMIAELEYNCRPPWAEMKSAAWARKVTGKWYTSNSVHSSSRVLSLQLFLPAIPLCFVAQASMHVEVLEAKEGSAELAYQDEICEKLMEGFAGPRLTPRMLPVSYRESLFTRILRVALYDSARIIDIQELRCLLTAYC